MTLSFLSFPTGFASAVGLSPLPHAASCSLKALQHWDPEHPLDEWAATLSCALAMDTPPHATADYKPSMNSTGWDVFEAVITTAGCSDAELGCQAGAAAAGFLEGWLSAQRISDHLHNVLANLNVLDGATVNSSDPRWSALVAYEREQESWTVRGSSAPTDAVMSVVPHLWAQQAGIAAGLAKAGAELFGLTPWRAAVTINLMAEQDDVLDKLFPDRRVDWFSANLTLAERTRATLAREHCSAFVALGEYNEELFVGHNMWWSFYAMMPVLKTYTWEALPEAARARGADTGAAAVARRVQMSSLPGALSSIDDIYSLPASDQRLAVMETTNPLYDHALYEKMSPRSLWCWARVMAANLLATDGAAWVELFSLHNSGTYNNMWMVVDYKRFAKGEPLLPQSGVLTIAEQLPGLISVSDETRRLASSGYFASYNEPYLNATVHASGAAAYDAAMRKRGVTAFGYQLAGRAHLFRAYAHLLGSLEGAKKLLRWNKFQTDPVVLNSPDPSRLVVPATYGALASRGDLNPFDDDPQGGMGPLNSVATNAKLISSALLNRSQMLAQGGPTHDDQPVFSWANAPPAIQRQPHRGQPDTWDFGWLTLEAAAGPL